MEISKQKSNDVKNKFKNLENMKNTLNFVHNAFVNNKEKLINLKGKIVENMNFIEEKLMNVRNFKTYHNQLSSMIKDLSRKSEDSLSHTNIIFHEIKNMKLNQTTSFSPRIKLKKKKDFNEMNQSSKLFNNKNDEIIKSPLINSLDLNHFKIKNLTNLIEEKNELSKLVKYDLRKYPLKKKINSDFLTVSKSLSAVKINPSQKEDYHHNKQNGLQNKKSQDSNYKHTIKLHKQKSTKDILHNYKSKEKITTCERKTPNKTNYDNKHYNKNIIINKSEAKLMEDQKTPFDTFSKKISTKNHNDLGIIHDQLIEHYSEVMNYKKGISHLIYRIISHA